MHLILTASVRLHHPPPTKAHTDSSSEEGVFCVEAVGTGRIDIWITNADRSTISCTDDQPKEEASCPQIRSPP